MLKKGFGFKKAAICSLGGTFFTAIILSNWSLGLNRRKTDAGSKMEVVNLGCRAEFVAEGDYTLPQFRAARQNIDVN